MIGLCNENHLDMAETILEGTCNLLQQLPTYFDVSIYTV